MAKKVLVLGTGAQGTTVVRRLDEEANVEKIICADYDEAAARELAGTLNKVEGCFVDASKREEITALIEGCDLVVNALPLEYGKNVLEAALEAKCNYQDFAACEGIADTWEESMEVMLTEYSDRFRGIGKLAIIGTGSAPGVMCVVARDTMKYIDECDTIYMNIYEGVEARRFQPYWWSPKVALGDMADLPLAYINDKICRTRPFSLPIVRNYDYVGYPVRLVEHAHDEPFYMGRNSKTLFKGAHNIYFKYGGVGVEFAEPLSRAGLLSKEAVEVNGQKIVPHDLVLGMLPAPPRFSYEIKEILDEGIISDSGAFVVEAMGKKDGKPLRVESHLFAPGLVESYEKYGISGEQYLTGQGGFLFTKLFIDDKMSQTGLISSDMLTPEENDQVIAWAAELDITVERRFEYDDPYYENQEDAVEYEPWWEGDTIVPVDELDW